MGHADRPWLHNALGLDAQPWRVCLPASRGRRHSYSHSNINTYRYADANSHRDTNTESYADAEAASYAAPAAIAATGNKVQVTSCCRKDRRSAYRVSFGSTIKFCCRKPLAMKCRCRRDQLGASLSESDARGQRRDCDSYMANQSSVICGSLSCGSASPKTMLIAGGARYRSPKDHIRGSLRSLSWPTCRRTHAQFPCLFEGAPA
jgi:hypothetical protein